MNRRTLCIAAAAVMALAATAADAQAPAWPEHPVKLVLSQPPGSGPDNVARVLAERLQRMWGQAVIVDNRPGGQNTIGAQAAARSAPDGYTFYFATTAALVTNSYLFKTLPYDPQKDFVPVGFVARSPFAILVETDSPIRTLDDLLARSKAAPGTLTIGNEGPRTFGGMIARLFNARAKVDTNLVSYASVGVTVQDLLGKHIDAAVADVASTANLVKQGKLRMLATTSGARLPGWDNVPALSERYPGFEMIGWFAVVAPTGTPEAAVQRFNRDLNTLLADPDVAGRIAAIGPIAAGGMSTEQVGGFLRQEHNRWGAATKEIGILPE